MRTSNSRTAAAALSLAIAAALSACQSTRAVVRTAEAPAEAPVEEGPDAAVAADVAVSAPEVAAEDTARVAPDAAVPQVDTAPDAAVAPTPDVAVPPDVAVVSPDTAAAIDTAPPAPDVQPAAEVAAADVIPSGLPTTTTCTTTEDCADVPVLACQAITCDTAASLCVINTLANSAKCSDGDACTTGDHCFAGQCTASKTDCSDDSVCTDDVCNPLNGACIHPFGEGTCDDGDACTSGDHCLNGACAGTWANCNDLEPCTIDLCNASTGKCSHTFSVGPCQDGDACTSGEACASGSCKGGKAMDCNDGMVCTDDSCSVAKGCIHTPSAPGKSCGANSVCVAGGGCVVNLKCMGMPYICDDNEECTVEFCDYMDGCIYQLVKDGVHCDDNDPCTPMAKDKCLGGKCSNPVNLCTCVQDSDCVKFDDGDLCNGTYACLTTDKGKLCAPKPDSAISCAQPGQSTCKLAVCQPETGACLVKAADNGQWCDDAQACSGGAQCQGGACVPQGAQNCDDGDSCTADSCSPILGCMHSPVDTDGACAAASLCAGGCDDLDPCTNDQCQGSQCTHSAVDCSDGNSCVVGTCTTTGAASYTCSVTPKISWPKLIPTLTCNGVGAPGQCPTGYSCVAPSDEPSLGTCEPTATIACEDGKACTIGDSCNAGKCQSGPAPGCDDDNPCTTDSCGANGCLNTAIAGCSICLNESFGGASATKDFAGWSAVPDYVDWQIAPDENQNPRVLAQWKGPLLGATGTEFAFFHARRLHFAAGVAPQIDFWYRTSFGSVSCGSDDLQVTANGVIVFRRCDATPSTKNSGWQHQTVNLSAFTGAPVDLEFRIAAGTSQGAGGTVEIDKVRVAGACTTACVGADFEARSDARDVPSSPVPQAWQFPSTNAGYITWGKTQTGGHTGVAAYSAQYAGLPQGATVATAKFIITTVHPVAGSQLHFSSRAVVAADSSCDADVLSVYIGDKLVHKLCKQQLFWSTVSLDLSQWADKDVDITFEVKTGNKAQTAGLFQVDDVAVTGACSYACWAANYDNPSGPGKFLQAEDKGAAAWAAGPESASSPPNGFGTTFAPSTPSFSMATAMFEGTYRWPMPVTGATLTLNAKVTSATSVCPGEALLRVRAIYGTTNMPPWLPMVALSNPNSADLLKVCADTGGWQFFAAEIGEQFRARKFVPLLVARKYEGDTAMSVAVDDVLVRCH